MKIHKEEQMWGGKSGHVKFEILRRHPHGDTKETTS
jgi:hypothetical protein